jgi:hypothetical protein
MHFPCGHIRDDDLGIKTAFAPEYDIGFDGERAVDDIGAGGKINHATRAPKGIDGILDPRLFVGQAQPQDTIVADTDDAVGCGDIAFDAGVSPAAGKVPAGGDNLCLGR